MDENTTNVISKESHKAISSHLRNYTVALVDHSDTTPSICSGTVVRILDRLFIATAAHLLNSANLDYIRPFSTRVKNRVDKQGIFAGAKAHSRFDICYLEVSKEFEQQYFGNHFCDVSNIGCFEHDRLYKPTMVVGTPATLATYSKPTSSQSELKGTILTYRMSTVPQSDWRFLIPEHQRSPDSDSDIFLPYPKGEEQTVIAETEQAHALPKPRGLSGAGVWDECFKIAEIWSPQSSKLIGIQTAWYEETECLRAVQIKHWLRLIFENFVDLRGYLIAEFGQKTFCPDNFIT